MSGYASVDGTISPVEDARIPVRDRGFLYGDAAFETIRSYGGTLFAWDRHVERLQATCESLALSHSHDAVSLRETVIETLDAAGYNDAYVRLSITRGVQPGRLTPREETDPSVVVLVEPLPRGGITGESVWSEPARCVLTSVRRVPDDAIPARAKTHNYLNGILARIDGRAAGADEVIMQDRSGRLTEGATSNLFFVRDGTVCTPSTDTLPVLPGITRATVIDLAEQAGISVTTDTWSSSVMDAVDAAFLTNSTWEIRPIRTFEGRELQTDPIVSRLRGAYDRHVEEQCYDP